MRFVFPFAVALLAIEAFATQVKVLNDHVHGFYYPTQPVKLTISVSDDSGSKLANGTVSASLDDTEGAFLIPETKFDLANANPFVITGKFDRAGILHLKLSSQDIADFPKRADAPFWVEAIHYNPVTLQKPVMPPQDFDRHWKELTDSLPAPEPTKESALMKMPGRLVLIAKGSEPPTVAEGEIVKVVTIDESAIDNANGRRAAILDGLSAARQLAADTRVDPGKLWLEGHGAAGGIGFAVLSLSGSFSRAAIVSPKVNVGNDPYLDDRIFAKKIKCPISVAFGDIDVASSPALVQTVCNAIPSYDRNARLLKGIGRQVPDDIKADLANWLANPPQSERLWPDGQIPDWRDFQTIPEMEWFAPTNNKSKVCIIIAPGGGYSGIAYQHEGLRTARNFLALGMHVVILRYRTPPSGIGPMHHSAQQDAQRCVRIVRSQAKIRGFDPERIGMTGFSAGGHLTCVTACNSQTPAYEPVDELDKIPCHLNFAAPVYPAYLLKYPDIRLPPRGEEVDNPFTDALDFDSKTPPMCFIHGDDDGHSAVGSIRAYEQLRRMKIRGEIHVFSGVNHGFGGSVRHGWQPSGWEIQVANFTATLGFMPRIDAIRWPDEK